MSDGNMELPWASQQVYRILISIIQWIFFFQVSQYHIVFTEKCQFTHNLHFVIKAICVTERDFLD